jgi:gluconokinase
MSTANTSPNKPVVIIVMGVSGCGKSTLATYLADTYTFEYVEADDYHTPTAVTMMVNGIPLTDEQREPWIQALCGKLTDLTAAGKSVVMAYSGLRSAHRARFRALGLPMQFIHLIGSKELIRERMLARTNHFMPAGLIDSQFAALEPTDNEADIVEISVLASVPTIIENAVTVCDRFISTH